VKPWFHRDDAVIAAEHLPAVLVDVAARRGVHPDRLLAGTRLFEADLLRPGAAVSPAGLARMIENAVRLDLGRDLFFLLGHVCAPTALGPVGPLVASAADLDGALRALVRHRDLWAPHLFLARIRAPGGCWLLVEDAIGLGDAWPRLREAILVLVAARLGPLTGRRPQPRVVLPGPAPAAVEPWHEAFGGGVRFEAPVSALWFDAAALRAPVLTASRTRYRIGVRACAEARRQIGPRTGLLEAVHRDLFGRDRREADLVSTAARFGASPATFKRRLREHGLRFQQIADRAALHRVLLLLLVRGRDLDGIVDELGFSDPSNFRRAFKRWAGYRPRQLLGVLGPE
jgi:AraC-like DNA-binding protein